MLCLQLLLTGQALAQDPAAAPAQPTAQADAATQPPVASFDAAWKIIQDSYFDPTFHGLDWVALRAELRPKAEAARNTRELREVIEEMLHRLGDSHMALIPRELAQSIEAGKSRPKNPGSPPSDGPKSHEGDLGLEVRIKEREALVTRVAANGPAAEAGVKPGWIIRSVGEQAVSESLEPVWADKNVRRAEFMAWALITGELSGAPGSGVDVEFEDGAGRRTTLTLTREHVQGEPAKLGYLPTLYARLTSQSLPLENGGTVGLIRFNLWMVPIVQGLDQKIDQFRSADGIILDLRGNLGGLGGMVLGVSGHFLKDRISLGTLKMRDNDLIFYTNPRLVNPSGERVEPFSGPVAILIDGISLSAAEIFAGGMQAIGRARVFGEPSGGQALPAIWDRLPNGDVLYHAFGDFVTPTGVRLEGRGVSPDEVVPLRRRDLLAGRDATLEAALHWISQQKHGAGVRAKGQGLN